MGGRPIERNAWVGSVRRGKWKERKRRKTITIVIKREHANFFTCTSLYSERQGAIDVTVNIRHYRAALNEMCAAVDCAENKVFSISISDLLLLFCVFPCFICSIQCDLQLSFSVCHQISQHNNKQHKRNGALVDRQRGGGGKRTNIGIYVTCCEIIYLFDRCFPFCCCIRFAYLRGWSLRRLEGEIKSSSIIPRDSVSEF